MKKFAGVLGVALVLSGAPASAGCGNRAVAQVTIGAVSPALTAFLRDEPESEDGDREGGGVIDPTPQDDGSDGVDDGSGDGQPA